MIVRYDLIGSCYPSGQLMRQSSFLGLYKADCHLGLSTVDLIRLRPVASGASYNCEAEEAVLAAAGQC